MSRPPFSVVFANYSTPSSVTKQQLFQDIGFNQYVNNPAYNNTCAIRVSLALVKSGFYLVGGKSSHFIQSGPHSGKRIEVLQHALVEVLRKPACLGQPDLEFNTPGVNYDINKQNALNIIGNKSGIISFYTWNTYQGGHIDLVSPSSGGFACAGSCHWQTEKVIFWELP